MTIDYKKIIFTGPPGMGKSTIKKVYFDKISPKSLLNEPLKPTRGVASNIYSLLNNDIGIFDLAGQENHNWLSNEYKIFDFSNLIICIFDVTNSLESILDYLIKIFILKRELKLERTNIIIFLHKIDLVSSQYLTLKTKAINEFLEEQKRLSGNYRIYNTSIDKKYFLQTFIVIFNIIKKLCKIQDTEISNKVLKQNYLNSSFFNEIDMLETSNEAFLEEIKNLKNNLFKLNANDYKNKRSADRIKFKDLLKFDEGICILNLGSESNKNINNVVILGEVHRLLYMYQNMNRKRQFYN